MYKGVKILIVLYKMNKILSKNIKYKKSGNKMVKFIKELYLNEDII